MHHYICCLATFTRGMQCTLFDSFYKDIDTNYGHAEQVLVTQYIFKSYIPAVTVHIMISRR